MNIMIKSATYAFSIAISISSGIVFAEQNSHNDTTSSDSAHAKKPASESAHRSALWGYSGDKGPNSWGEMNAEYHLCKTGQNQSPVDIRKSVDRGLDNLEFHYSPAALAIINNGHTIQVNSNGNSYLIIGGKRYNLLQLHFHAPSEHKMGGRARPMEMHLVHQAADGRLAVVGVMIESGDKHTVLQKAWDYLPANIGNINSHDSVRINASSILPSNKSYFHYNGSLTTPPCSEGVNWFILKNPIQLSVQQIKSFRDLIEDNARIIQPLHGRIVMHK